MAWYSRRFNEWRAKMGAGRTERGRAVGQSAGFPSSRAAHCPRYLAHVLQRKARAWRVRYEYQYDWRSWLPPVWTRIISCETFSNFRHNSGTYQGAFGFHYDSWDRFRFPGYPSEAYEATPRQQYEVALAIHHRYGFSGWGCAS